MQKEKNKWEEAIAKILELTQKGEIFWTSAKPDLIPQLPSGEKAESVFLARFKDRILRIYKRWYSYHPFFSTRRTGLLTGLTLPKPEEPIRTSEVVLEMVNEHGDSLWTFPSDSMLIDLIKAIKYQVSGVKEFIDELLSNE